MLKYIIIKKIKEESKLAAFKNKDLPHILQMNTDINVINASTSTGIFH
jgi:hypothetical protein